MSGLCAEAASMLRTKNKNLLVRQSGAQDVQGKVCLDNPNVVIDRMTDLQPMIATVLPLF